MPSWLFHNNGDGTFTDVSKTSGIANSMGKAWGAVATDLNNDGLLDLFVSNDTEPNFVFMNRGKGRFEETGTSAGVAYSADGRARSGMGLDSADFNQDGWMDLFVANIDLERFSIYQNNHDETFDDHTAAADASDLAGVDAEHLGDRRLDQDEALRPDPLADDLHRGFERGTTIPFPTLFANSSWERVNFSSKA